MASEGDHIAQQLAAGDPATWETAFQGLFRIAVAVAKATLGNVGTGESEDVAMETLEEIVAKGASFESWGDLKALTAAISHHKAVDRLRRHLSQKRGGKHLVSLDGLSETDRQSLQDESHQEIASELTIQELRELLGALLNKLKRKHRIVLSEHFLAGLSHKEIATKHGIAPSSVGVYIQRGIEEVRTRLARIPSLRRELLQALSDEGMVRIILPLVSALELGGHLFSTAFRYSEESPLNLEPKSPKRVFSDDDIMEAAQETLPASKNPTAAQQRLFLELLRAKFPHQIGNIDRKDRE
jgi:RNA polymerase sigma factor (sigma-70 family)